MFEIFVNPPDNNDLKQASMYIDARYANGKTSHLKPAFFVLNKLIRYTLDPKVGDSIHLHNDAPKILIHFGAGGGRFSLSDYMWGRIEQTAVDPHKSLPYAPYLMHIIEQVVGASFSKDVVHRPYSVRHLAPLLSLVVILLPLLWLLVLLVSLLHLAALLLSVVVMVEGPSSMPSRSF